MNKPELLQQWLFPWVGARAKTKNEFREGGSYQHDRYHLENIRVPHKGTYKEIISNKKF